MRILFTGDSLIKGSVGVNWVKILGAKHKYWNIKNAGENGQTLAKVSQRLLRELDKAEYDVIFIAAGANDLLIQSFFQKGYLFKAAAAFLLKKGYRPAENVAAFEEEYRQCIDQIQKKTRATVIVSTMGCINEDLDAESNKMRCAYNKVIREIAAEKDLALVDAGALFDGYLRRYKTQNYLLENFFNITWFDKLWCKLGCPDHLSKKRGLYLTIDGVHLNKEGAKLYYIETRKQIEAISSGTKRVLKGQLL